jgi:transcriptional regulator with XRE-family HTH domain
MKNKNEILKKLDNLAQEKSNWQAEAEYRLENQSWLKNSQMIALKILRCLRKNNISQKELAKKLGVSPQQVNKWVKGSENFRLDTISKIEQALQIKLIEVVQEKQTKLHNVAEYNYKITVNMSANYSPYKAAEPSFIYMHSTKSNRNYNELQN